MLKQLQVTCVKTWENMNENNDNILLSSLVLLLIWLFVSFSSHVESNDAACQKTFMQIEIWWDQTWISCDQIPDVHYQSPHGSAQGLSLSECVCVCLFGCCWLMVWLPQGRYTADARLDGVHLSSVTSHGNPKWKREERMVAGDSDRFLDWSSAG